jgi:glycosyltransferase involved in cell wall biosynthesis
MRILYVIHDFFPRFYGGAERYVLNLGHQMQQLGHEVKVLTYGLDEPTASFTGQAGPLLSRSYFYDGIEVLSIRHPEPPPDVQFRIEDEQVAGAVGLLLERSRTDIVHVAHPMRMSSSRLAAQRRGIPVVMTLTDFWLACPRGRFFKVDFSPCSSPDAGRKCIRECQVPGAAIERYAQALEMFSGAEALIAPSRFLIGVFARCGWSRPIAHIPHGVDYRFVRPLPAPPGDGRKLRFGYIGVLKKFKGIDLLLRSFKAVAGDDIELVLHGTLAGDEGFRPELESLVAQDPRVRLMGRYDHGDLPAVMAGIDVMVVPSTTLDSYGLVVVESLAYGVPVIASDMVGAAHEFLRDGENGFVFPVEEPKRLRELIEMVARDPAVVDRLRAGISLPPRIEEEAFMVESVYSRLLAGRGR